MPPVTLSSRLLEHLSPGDALDDRGGGSLRFGDVPVRRESEPIGLIAANPPWWRLLCRNGSSTHRGPSVEGEGIGTDAVCCPPLCPPPELQQLPWPPLCLQGLAAGCSSMDGHEQPLSDLDLSHQGVTIGAPSRTCAMSLVPRWRFMTDEAKELTKRTAVSALVVLAVLLLFRALLPWVLLVVVVWWIWKALNR